MQCPSCRTENKGAGKFCRECGAKLVMACPACRAEIVQGDKFCSECGQDLRGAQSSPATIDYARFQSYTPRHLADKILTTRSAMEGERKLVTVLFADVADFTELSERLDPEEVHTIMDGCFKILMDEIHRLEGTVNQFTGDGVMALFGAPVAHEDHAVRACHAALAIQKSLAEFGRKVQSDYGLEFMMRIGLNSGPVIVGAIGDDLRMDYTAVGDTTNLASRMQGLAQPGTVLVSENTQRLIKDYFGLNSLGQLQVKGKQAPHEVFELIKAGDVTTRIGASVAKGLTRFVGRRHSMAALMEAYQKVIAGTGQVVGIVGEAGVGKSRILLEFRQLLARDEFRYLEGRCIHFGGAMPYLPVLDILKSYFEIVEGEREVVIRKGVKERLIALDAKFQGITVPIQDLLSLKVEDEAYLKLEPKQRKERVFEALRDLIVRVSQQRPLVIAIEDLHWIDKTSEEFVDYFIGWLANVKVMLVLLYRPEYTHRWGNKSYFNRIGLDQLTLESSAELVKAILEGGETAPELSELILNRAAGNPLFMEELTHSLLENGSIQMKDKQYVLTRKPSDLQVPDTIQGIISARIDRLEENLKRIMQVASVIGREFAFRILQAISEIKEDLKSQLLNLQGLELIYEKSLFPELEYIFKHALTQEVAYNSLLSNRRKEIHKMIGLTIEQLYAENLQEFYEVLAHHFTRCEDIDRACRYLKLAGQKAVRSHAPSEAYEFYKKAIEFLNRSADTPENRKELLEIIILMRPPMVSLSYPEGSLFYYQLGERLAKELGDTKSLASIHSGMSSYFTVSGDHLAGIRVTEEGFEEARKGQDFESMVRFGYALCTAYSAMARNEKIVGTVPELINLIEEKGRKSDFFAIGLNPYSQLCGICGVSLSVLGRFDEGAAYLEKALNNALQIGDAATLANIRWIYGFHFFTKGEYKAAKGHLEKGLASFEEARWHMGVALTLCTLGVANSFLGDPEAGKIQAQKGLKMYADTRMEFMLSLSHLCMGIIHFHLNDLDSAISSTEEALRLSLKNGEKGFEGFILVWLGSILGKKSPQQKEKAEDCFSKGLEILQDLKTAPAHSMGHMLLGEFYLDTDRKEKALAHLKEAEAQFQKMGMAYWLDQTRKLLERI